MAAARHIGGERVMKPAVSRRGERGITPSRETKP